MRSAPAARMTEQTSPTVPTMPAATRQLRSRFADRSRGGFGVLVGLEALGAFSGRTGVDSAMAYRLWDDSFDAATWASSALSRSTSLRSASAASSPAVFTETFVATLLVFGVVSAPGSSITASGWVLTSG